MNKDEALKLALEALENFKEVVVAAQVLGIKVGATGKNMRLGESFLHDEAIIAIKEALATMSTTCGVQSEQKQTGIREIRVTETVKPKQESVTKPYAYEYGQDNGDGTYTVVIKKGDLEQIKPAVYDYVRPKNIHKDWPIKELFDRPQPEQEPVTWMCKAFDGEACEQSNHDECENPIPLYTTPQKREWIGLTDEHIGIVLNDPNIAEVRQGTWLVLPYAYAYAIEAKSKELNK